MELTLESSDARVVIDLSLGARIASLQVYGLELLVAHDPDPIAWGCYPMAPYAGRVRNGRFRFEGREYTLPLRLPPHAIHGSVFEREWQHEGEGRASIDLGPDWPFPGRVVQTLNLDDDGLEFRMELHAEETPFPASLGWHPWFRKRLARGSEAQLSFDAGSMFLRDETGISSSERVRPPPGPWDDCFTDVTAPPVITWPGGLRLTIESRERHWVVYDEPPHALCVEPMTSPPDSLNFPPTIAPELAPAIVSRDLPLVTRMRLGWARS